MASHGEGGVRELVPRSSEPWQRATACSRLLVTTMPLITGTSDRMAASCKAWAVE